MFCTRHRAVVFVLSALLAGLLCTEAGAISLFSVFKKEPYVAKVGDRVITTKDFVEEVNRLHMTNRVGKTLAESENKVFWKQDYRKFLEELIDKELMVIEAERLGLDKEPAFKNAIRLYKLNLFLDRLRNEEVLQKVKVSDEEVLARYKEELKKKKKKEDKEPTEGELAAIRREIYAEKVEKREKEFFENLRRNAQINIYEDVLKGLSKKDIGKEDVARKVVAKVNGEPIYAVELLSTLERIRKFDLKTKKDALDRLILNKLLDQEALSRGYERDKKLRHYIERYRKKLLVRMFKDRVILPLIEVSDKEIEEYYKKNKEKYKAPDKFNISVIALANKELADSILKELKRGGDFEYLAREYSVDPSRVRGGLIGWVTEGSLPKKARELLKKAKKGEVVGPIENRKLLIIYRLNDFKEGKPLPLERVRRRIDITIGRKKFKETLDLYLKRLRKIVKIEINEKELASFK